MTDLSIHGNCDPSFLKVKEAFITNFENSQETGACVSVVVSGKTVVDLWAGHMDMAKTKPWQENTLANIFSCTKGILALCAIRLVDQGKLSLDKPVHHYWPDFAQNGKEDITVRMLLNHSSGIAALNEPLPTNAIYEWDTMIRAIEKEAPWWTPGEKHGYQVTTFGWLVGQVVKSVTGFSVGDYIRQEIAGPLGLDIHIGLSDEALHRSAQVLPKRLPSIHKDFLQLSLAMMRNPFGKTAKAFSNPISISTGMNTRSWKQSEIPAANGQSNARALSKLYGILSNGGKQNGIRLLSKEALLLCSQEESCGLDEVLNINTRFSLGFMLSQQKKSAQFGPNLRNFGHSGAGGSLTFADPDAQIGFAYIPNWLDSYILLDPRANRLIDALYDCL